MRKILLGLFAFTIGVFSSCSNDDIVISESEPLTLTVSLSNFFSCYDFEDTAHDINQIGEYFRTFNSEQGLSIQVRTLFYDKETELLVDSVVNYVTNTNDVTASLNLVPGDYYAITTVCFALPSNGACYWDLVDKNKLSTVKIKNRYRSRWSILSQSTEEITIRENQVARLSTTPSPVGALVYNRFENFQYVSESTYGTIADNGVRLIGIFSRRLARSYNLSPNAVNKYNYSDDAGSNTWYNNEVVEPSDFSTDWTYFKTNMYGFYYVLDPEQTITFGVMYEGDTGFSSYGEQIVEYTSGNMYLAYWDYFRIGEPYFGEANNNQWKSYKGTSQFTPSETVFKSVQQILKD